jgi:hypothetical protein
MSPIERQALAAYDAEDRHIPDSDLDNEQPITLHVRTTLGEIRRIRRYAADLEAGARAVAKREAAERDYDANL